MSLASGRFTIFPFRFTVCSFMRLIPFKSATIPRLLFHTRHKYSTPCLSNILNPLSHLDMRVGRIINAMKHPNAEQLYVEDVEIGRGETRQVVSGLAKYYQESDLIGCYIVVICNLKPVKLRGIVSEAMLLAAAKDEEVEIVTPPDTALVGEPIRFGKFSMVTPSQSIFTLIDISKKTNPWLSVTEKFHTSSECVAMYADQAWMTSAGQCRVASIRNGVIR